MELERLVENFIEVAHPLWNDELAKQLVFNKLKDFKIPYTLTACVLKDGTVEEKTLPLSYSPIKIVLPSISLQPFYEEHGLQPLAIQDALSKHSIDKVKRALDFFKKIPELEDFIITIVQSIQLLKSEDDETDISYSHPDVPFSIFVSICERNSEIADLRVAESILHEAMHLLLTLIEGVVPLVLLDSKAVYYSPWRDEERPIRGVLHGMFVFKGILDFYKISNSKSTDQQTTNFLNERILAIEGQIAILTEFAESPGLTSEGQKIVLNLMR